MTFLSYELWEIAESEEDAKYEYIDEYYDGSYESQINRFGSNSTNSGFGYYDSYNTGYNNCYSCYSGPSVSIGFGFGMGYGYGWPYYSYYYPYYSPYYPYYGYNSYWAGYNAGYWAGYYGYPYGGGYYPGYGGGYYPDYPARPVVYGPRGSNVTGTTIPRNRTSGSGSGTVSNQKTVVASGGAISTIPRDGTAVASTGQSSGNQVVTGRTVRIGKPESEVVNDRVISSQNPVKGNRSSISSNIQPEKTYQKPKSYRNLSTQQSNSRSEYVRPTNKTNVETQNKSRSGNIRTNPTSPREVNNSGSRNRNIYTPSKSNSSTYRSTAPRKSYSSPSRSNTSSRSYSTPSSTRSGSGSSSVSRSRSTSKSSGSSSRSYSGSSSRSSSSGSRSTGSSRSGGGSPNRR
jgi:hypothetical protein